VTYPLFSAVRLPRAGAPDRCSRTRHPETTGLPGHASAVLRRRTFERGKRPTTASWLAQSIDAVDRDLDCVHEMIEQRLGVLGRAAAMPARSWPQFRPAP